MYKDKIITAVFRELVCIRCQRGVYRYQHWMNSTKAGDNNYAMKCIECGDSFRAINPHPVIIYRGRTFRLQELKKIDDLGLVPKAKK